MSSQADVTQMLLRWQEGDQQALEQLLRVLYEQLRVLAHNRLLRERAGHTLNSTALVHEAYLKLVQLDRMQWQDRAHFLAMASTVMRRILIDYAHQRRALKRGRDQHRVAMDEAMLCTDKQAEALLDLDAALTRLKTVSPRQSQVLSYRYFGGLSLQETAEVVGVSLTTVKSDLRFARAWLAGQLDARTLQT